MGCVVVLVALLLASVALSLMLLGVIAGGGRVRSLVGQRHWKLDYVLDAIGRHYVDSVRMDSLEDRAIEQLLGGLDPHSSYLPASLNQQAMEPLRGDFEGIGVTFNMLTDTVIVQSVIADGPAAKAGVLMGDRVVAVDSVVIAGVSMGQDSVMRLLRGPSGSRVRVRIARYGVAELVELTIERGRIPISSVEAAYMAEGGTGVLRLSRFSATTPRDVLGAVQRLAAEGMERMVLDLRENGGGSVEAALFMANLFLQEGDPVIYTEGKSRPRREFRCPQPGALRNMPLVVLIDEYSASASEIVAGALQDNDRAMVVGRRSFGKGLVQEVLEFPDGSGLRLTTQRYYIPSQRSIQKPYGLGNQDAYVAELDRRWSHGELLAADSVSLDSTKLHFTLGGRPVYGGGGIMPDVFVPLDTSLYSQAYSQIVRRGMHIRFAQRYVDAHREALSAFATPAAMEDHLRGEAVLEDFMSFLRSNGLGIDAPQLRDQRERLTTVLHALIAQGILERAGYFAIMQRLDATLQKGLELLATGNSRPRIASTPLSHAE